jgi:serine/threonine protein kinase
MKKYEIQGVIGMGAYGVVLKAVDKNTKAIGKIENY